MYKALKCWKRSKLSPTCAEHVTTVTIKGNEHSSNLKTGYASRGRKKKTWATGALSSMKGAARLINEASPTPTNLERIKKAYGKKQTNFHNTSQHQKAHNLKSKGIRPLTYDRLKWTRNWKKNHNIRLQLSKLTFQLLLV